MRLAYFTALAVIVIRIALFYTGHPPEGTQFMPVHLLALVLLPFFIGHFLLKRAPQAPFPAILREAFKGAAVYALLYGIFIWLYYKGIDVTEFPMKVNALVDKAVAEGAEEAQVREQVEGFFTPFKYASVTFFALLVIGAINALVVGLLHDKVLRKMQ